MAKSRILQFLYWSILSEPIHYFNISQKRTLRPNQNAYNCEISYNNFMGDLEISSNEMLKVGYARTSQDSEDIQRQVNEIYKLGVPEHLIFSDNVRSGATDPQKRPGYSQMFKLILTGMVKEIYVTDLSRLGRDAKGTLKELWEIQDRGITVISMSKLDAVVLDSPKELQPILHSAILLGADLQRKKVQEDTKSGLVRARERGVTLGRPQTVFDREKIDFYMRRGLSEHAAVLACGYSASTFYKWKKKQKGEVPDNGSH